MASEFRITRRIEFADTDMAGIVHFSNYFRFMEAAEHEFFRSLGFRLHEERDGAMLGFARVSAEASYRRPLHYQDEVEIRLAVREKTRRSFAYDFAFRVPGAKEVVARGRLKVVCVMRGPEGERLRAADIPAPMAAAVEVAADDALDQA